MNFKKRAQRSPARTARVSGGGGCPHPEPAPPPPPLRPHADGRATSVRTGWACLDPTRTQMPGGRALRQDEHGASSSWVRTAFSTPLPPAHVQLCRVESRGRGAAGTRGSRVFSFSVRCPEFSETPPPSSHPHPPYPAPNPPQVLSGPSRGLQPHRPLASPVWTFMPAFPLVSGG